VAPYGLTGWAAWRRCRTGYGAAAGRHGPPPARWRWVTGPGAVGTWGIRSPGVRLAGDRWTVPGPCGGSSSSWTTGPS